MSNGRTRRLAGSIASVFLSALLLLTGCTVREEVILAADGSGTANLEITLHPVMVQYMSDLMSAMTGVEGEFPVFDTEQIAASFAERESVELTRLERLARGSIRMGLSFDAIAALAEEDDAPGIFDFQVRGGRRELTLTLNGDSVASFMGFAPEESATMAQFMLPPNDGSVSAAEYRDEMAWALEEYEDRAVVERILDESVIEVRVRPAGRIVSQEGGRLDGDAAVFSVPVIELLTLQSERIYSLVFEP